MRVLIAPDKFKGTLSGLEAAESMQTGWKKARPGDEIRCLPICDGGDGFGEAFAHLEGARRLSFQTVDAAHRPIRADWWWQEEKKMAIIESARIIGLAQLPKHQYHPFQLDTMGLGAILSEARAKGALTCLVGIGGSATNDGGFGMARALGWRFQNAKGEDIQSWIQLDTLSSIHPPPESTLFSHLIIASDVSNMLLGEEGASSIYGPQKGLKPNEIQQSDSYLKALSECLDGMLGKAYRNQAGAGAAGGLGYGLMAFLGGKIQSGFDLFATSSQLVSQIEWADMVITGEGSLDQSTLMGKGVGEVAQLCQARKTPCIGLSGIALNNNKLKDLFHTIESITPALADGETAQKDASKWLAILAQKVGSGIQT